MFQREKSGVKKKRKERSKKVDARCASTQVSLVTINSTLQDGGHDMR